jgi:predicted ATPase
MSNVKMIHERVFTFLENFRITDPSLRYTFRRSNRANRLEDKYWFYGNEGYMAISFWTGMDWKNRTPNIIFVILADSGESYLEINVSDSDQKRNFVIKDLTSPLKLELIGIRYRKSYEEFGEDYLAALRYFLENDKVVIDKIIDERKEFLKKNEINIGPIDNSDFESQRQKILQYRQSNYFEKTESKLSTRPEKIHNIIIEGYGPINKVELGNIAFNTQWIFITGENGTGKTSILKALASSICGRQILGSENVQGIPFQTQISFYDSLGEATMFFRKQNSITGTIFPVTSGFTAYGQSRLLTGSIYSKQGDSKASLLSSLFEETPILIDLQSQFDNWRSEKQLEDLFQKRKDYITEILTDVIPNLYNILFFDFENGKPITSYIEKDIFGNELKKVSFNQLASGIKSMIAMLGDILVKFYDQQPDVFDPSEFTGVVIIDEIDIHLHPKLQKKLVEQLTITFPKIQFIASTHSPIPLLGAPKNSVIFTIERDAEEGVKAKRLDQKLTLGDLLPNTILTSPIFGLDDIIPSSHDVTRMIRTEKTYSDIEFNDKVKEKINQFLTDEEEQKLIQLFKSRRG